MDNLLVLGLLFLIIVLQLILLFKKPKSDLTKQVNELERQTNLLSSKSDDLKRTVGDEFSRNRQETSERLKEVNELVREMQSTNYKQNEKIVATLSESVEKLQQSNEKKLDQMRETVDEKLTSTLTKRLDSSFKVVGEQLENVHKSLGEMKELAGGVNDLQRVLSNVKTRGTWAEVQLGSILEQTLTSDQYACNVSTKKDGKRVEFAVKIPAKDDPDSFIWLPIDSKFPQEDYIRLSEAAERADKDGVEAAAKALERRIKEEAKTISDLYINVPETTNFAIMFLATEGLYAEVLRRPGLAEELQTKYRIMICGPTTVTAFLNTLRMGFKTIALDQKAADVWKVLGAAKAQYTMFEGVLAKAKKKIEEAGSTLDDATHRNSIIQKHLRSVETLQPSDADLLLGLEKPE